MSFRFWVDEAMSQTPANGADGTPLHSLFFDENGAYADLLLYFGSPQTSYQLQTRVNGGIDPITLTPAAALPERADNTAYQAGDTVSGAGMMWRCVAAGTSGDTPPRWLAQRGARVQDGGVVWHCVGAAHQSNAVRLALSADGLDAAQDGAALSLGPVLRGGAAVAVHIRVFNRVADRYDAPFTPQLALELNDCVETEALP